MVSSFQISCVVKTVAFYLFYSFFSLYSTGQNHPDDFPTAGNNFVMAYSKVYPEAKMGIRSLGNNTWDLSIFKPTGYDTLRMSDPLKTRYGKRFPGANIAVVTNPVKIEYLTIDSGRVYLTGMIDDFMEKKIPVLLRFTDKLLYRNPYLKMDEEYSDTSSTFFTSPYYKNPGTDSIKADIFYVRTGRIDAEGQLITPFGKFNAHREVVFVEKRVRGYKYSVFGWTPAPEYSIDKHYTFYRWYTKELKIPIAEAYLNDEDFVEYVSYQYDSPMKLNFTGQDVSCKDGKNGKVELTVIGGIPDYKYKWTNGAETKDLLGVSAGTYRVTVTDNRGRTITSYYTVSEPIVKLQAHVDIEHVSCRGNRDGRAKLNISGGKLPYDYAWSNDSLNETITNLAPGKIKYMVIDDGGCRIVDSIEILQPDEKLAGNIDVKMVSCYNGHNGTATIIPSGGTAPYRFIWNDGDTSRFKTNMRAGTYQVTIYDKRNCQSKLATTIKQPETEIKVEKNIKPVSCFGFSDGTAELNISGGKAPYLYFWSDSSTNKFIKGYGAGIYSVEIIDKNDCKITETIEITQPINDLKISVIKKDIACFGIGDGEIKVLTSGGTAPYEYLWNHGVNKAELKKLERGIYIVKVLDKNRCTITETVEILSPEKALFVDFEKTDIKCKNGNDGSIKLTVEGGTPGYSFLWSNKQTIDDIKGLKAGKYEVLVTDKNQCQLKKEIEIIEPESAIEIEIEKIDVNCLGEKSGSVYLNVKGGKPGYDFKWSNGETAPSLIGLGAGKYSVSISDNNQCVQTKIIEITEPEKLTVKYQLKNPDKELKNGEIKIDLSGGTKPYSILWDDGLQTSERKNLDSGIHQVQIKDSKNCVMSEVIELKRQ